MPVTTIVLQSTTFEEWLKAGHKFAGAVWQSASSIYDFGNLSWTIPQDFSNAVTNKDCEKQYREGLTAKPLSRIMPKWNYWICWTLLLLTMAIKHCTRATWYYFISTFIT